MVKHIVQGEKIDRSVREWVQHQEVGQGGTQADQPFDDEVQEGGVVVVFA